MPKDLRGFVEDNADSILRVPRMVAREHLSALIVQAGRPVMFESIEGYPGWRVLDLLFVDRRAQARVLDTAPDNVLASLAAALERPPVPPRPVDDAPHRQNILTGGKADLLALPAFRHGEKDPAPALIAMNICREPDGGAVNFSFTRMTPIDPLRATYLIGSSPHQRAILAAWEERGEAMPMACAIGTHPAYEIMASYSVPGHLAEFGELEMVGNLIGEAVETVPCETVPLEVPAHAEAIVEGWVRPGIRRDDGPGPSQALYYLPGASKQPVIEVSAITHRDRPILRQHNTLMFSDHQPLISLPHEALLYSRLRADGHDVREAFYVPWGGTLACVVQIVPQSDGEVRNVLMQTLGQRWPNAKLAIAIDADVDIGSAEDLVWSISTRVDPEQDLFVVPGSKGHPIDPAARPAAGGPRNVVTGKWGIDATRPPVSRPEARAVFERTLAPHRNEVRLKDFLD